MTTDERIAALEAFATAARAVHGKRWKRRLMFDVGYANPHNANNYYPATPGRSRRVPFEETLREWAVSWNRIHPDHKVLIDKEQTCLESKS